MRKSNGWMVDRAAETAETDRLARLGADLGRADAVSLAWSAHALAHVVGDIGAGVALIDHALRLNPNLAVAWQRSGWIHVYAGKPEVAIEHVHTAMRLSPLDPLMHLAFSAVAYGYFFLDDLDQSSTWSDRALQMRPDWPAALRVLAMSHALAGRERPAQEAMKRLRRLQPALRISNLHEQIFLKRPEHMEKFINAMRKAGLPE